MNITPPRHNTLSPDLPFAFTNGTPARYTSHDITALHSVSTVLCVHPVTLAVIIGEPDKIPGILLRSRHDVSLVFPISESDSPFADHFCVTPSAAPSPFLRPADVAHAAGKVVRLAYALGKSALLSPGWHDRMLMACVRSLDMKNRFNGTPNTKYLVEAYRFRTLICTVPPVCRGACLHAAKRDAVTQIRALG